MRIGWRPVNYPKSKRGENMNTAKQSTDIAVKDGDCCEVTAGTLAGKSGTARDIKISKSGQMTMTIVQRDGGRFKTLAKNVVRKNPGA